MPTDDATAPLPGTAYAVLAAQDEMMLWGRTEATEAALNEALAAYYAAAALDPDSLQAVLARTVGEALAEADGVPALIEQTRADVAAAFGIPQPLADAWRQIGEECAADIRAGHDAADCPQRVEITQLSDAAPRWMHGDCQPKEA